MHTIYKVTNTITGKVYIGQTSGKMSRRKSAHFNKAKNESSFKFHKALRKYDKSVFIWEIIDSVNTKQEANQREKYWVKEWCEL